jgi:hypothetical protein
LAKRWFLAFAAAAAVGGCAHQPAAPVRTGQEGASRPASLSELFDGSYQGRAVLVRNTGHVCPIWPRRGVVEIGEAVLTFPYLPGLTFSAPVQPDGSLHAEYGPAVLDGRVAGDYLSFAVRIPECETHYNLRFVWNHS